jgi:anti-sigma factor RsiW
VNPLDCHDFVELVTDHLEGCLDPETEARFEEHLAQCPGCEVYLDQFRQTISRVGRIAPESVDPVTLDILLLAFRDWKTT